MSPFEKSGPCEVCGYRRSTPGCIYRGRDLRLCFYCCDAGLHFATADPWDRPGFDCLHNIAIGLEHFAICCAGEEFSFGHWLKRLQRNILSGKLRDVCGCVTCNGLRNAPVVAGQLDGDLLIDTQDFQLFADGFSEEEMAGLVDLFDGDDDYVAGEDIPLFILRSMQPTSFVFCSDGSKVTVKDMIERHLQQNMEDTARGPVGPLAASAVAVRPRPAETPEELAHAQRYWRGFHLFGPVGYLDGPHWVDADGVCHLVPDRLPDDG